jgi:hypothetical protein
MRNSMMLAAALVAVTAATAGAQGRGRNTNGVPPGQRPPDGMCRVWVTGVAPGQQAAATDCATAEAQARLTANSRVIYGGHPGKGTKTNDGLLTRRRQLADGSWVVDRFRRDANGNITIVSTKPWKKGNKEQLRATKRQDKIEDRAEKRQDKIEGRSEKRRDDNLVTIGSRADLGRGNSAGKGNAGGKGKGKH